MSPFLLSLGSHSKQAGDKRNLPHAVSFFHATHLPLPEHVHGFISLQGSPRTLEGKEAHPWFDQPLDEPMVLLDDVVEIFDQDVSSTLSAMIPIALRSAIALG
jgi:hypothetical protein